MNRLLLLLLIWAFWEDVVFHENSSIWYIHELTEAGTFIHKSTFYQIIIKVFFKLMTFSPVMLDVHWSDPEKVWSDWHHHHPTTTTHFPVHFWAYGSSKNYRAKWNSFLGLQYSNLSCNYNIIVKHSFEKQIVCVPCFLKSPLNLVSSIFSSLKTGDS